MLVGGDRLEAYPPIAAPLKPVYKTAEVDLSSPYFRRQIAPLAQLAEQVTLNSKSVF
jgi:hypothetical protein